MVTEDYVSFETSKILKEIGFDGEFHKYYWGYEPGKEFLTEGNFNPEYDYPAPTLQMAMKWLREERGFIITIVYNKYYADNYIGFGFNIQAKGNPGEVYGINESVWNSYEEAVEAAIKYCLNWCIVFKIGIMCLKN